MKKQTIKFYSLEEIEELQTIAKLPSVLRRRSSLKSFCSKYDRKYDGAYAKMLTLRSSAKVMTPVIARASNSEVRIPLKGIRIENGELILSY